MAVEKTAVPMRQQPAEERIKNFNEVPLGYNEEEALKEASRCLQCAKKPCVEGCPVRIEIPAFIKALKEKDFQKAISIIHDSDSLPCVTGRVCPQEEQCQAVPPYLMEGTTTPSVLTAATSNLYFGQKYYWRVRAGHHLGNSSYCPYRSFTVIDTFALQSPADTATNIFLNATLKWKQVKGVLAYGYEIAKDQSFTEIVAESEVDTNFVTASYLMFGQQYYWRVRGRHVKDTSQWSNPYSFTSINTVDLKKPADLQQNVALKPVLQWTKQTGIINYELWLDSLSTFTNPIIKYKPNASDIQYQVSKTLAPQKTYYWKMRAYSDGGLTADTSAWSPVWSFVTIGTTGIPENNALSFIIYPNPASGKIFLKMESRETTTVQFELIDLLGKKLIGKTINLNTGQNLNEITLENVNNGIYVIRLRTGNGTINQKIFIEK